MNRAMTLVEVLAAAVLLSMLAVAMVAIYRMAARPMKAQEISDPGVFGTPSDYLSCTDRANSVPHCRIESLTNEIQDPTAQVRLVWFTTGPLNSSNYTAILRTTPAPMPPTNGSLP